MQREISVQEVEKTLKDDNINDTDTILVKRENKTDVIIMNVNEYKKIIEDKFVKKLKKGEEQIKNGEVTDGDDVLAEMRAKYGY